MSTRQIILSLAGQLGFALLAAAQPPATFTQPRLQPSPAMIQPNQPAVPVFPPQQTVVPLPSQTPGSIFGPPVGVPGGQPGELPSPPGAMAPASTGLYLPQQVIVGPSAAAVQAPAAPPISTISVPVLDEEYAWDQIADVVSDYFPIAREQRARRGESWCEGRIETVPQDGATWLEPHRNDSVGMFNRWESTFQSIRRRALVRVVPDASGYQIEVIVEKELEDLPRPERSTTGTATFSTDITLPSKRLEEVSRTARSGRWLSLGRDPALEQRMLAEMHARFNGATTASNSVFAPR